MAESLHRRFGTGLAEQGVELVLECQLLFLQNIDLDLCCGFDMGFHVLDLLIKLVVPVEQSHKVTCRVLWLN